MNYKRVARLLASGLNSTRVSEIIGCSPSRIAQLIKDDKFIAIYEQEKLLVESEDSEEQSTNIKYEAVEQSLLNRLLELAPISEMRDVVGALKTVGERQDRLKQRQNPLPLPGSNPIYNTVVQLNLPSHALPELHFSNNREVIAIGNQELAPLNSKGVTDLFKSMSASTGESLNPSEITVAQSVYEHPSPSSQEIISKNIEDLEFLVAEEEKF